jgi:hypothetical protein
MPNDHASTSGPIYDFPSISSGAEYTGEPQHVVKFLFLSNLLDRPKSFEGRKKF